MPDHASIKIFLKKNWKKRGGNFKFHTEEKKILEFHFICSFILFHIIIMQKIEYRNHTLFDVSAKNVSFKMAKIYKFHFGIGERRWHETRSESRTNHFWNTRWNGNKRKFPDDIRGKWLLRTTKQPRSHATLSPSFARGGRENIAQYKYHRLHVWTKMRVLIRETKAIETWIYGYDKRLKCSFSIIIYPNVDQYFDLITDFKSDQWKD